jgi:hypothetical protein
MDLTRQDFLFCFVGLCYKKRWKDKLLTKLVKKHIELYIVREGMMPKVRAIMMKNVWMSQWKQWKKEYLYWENQEICYQLNKP